MNHILEELWYGNIFPSERGSGLCAEEKALMHKITEQRSQLQPLLTEEEMKMLEAFEECHVELSQINAKETFVYAFRLGARIAIDIMGENLT